MPRRLRTHKGLEIEKTPHLTFSIKKGEGSFPEWSEINISESNQF